MAASEEKWRAAEEKEASLAASAGGAAGKSRRKPPAKGAVNDSAVYTAYVRVEPVHLLMLCDFCSAHDTEAKMWRAPKFFSPGNSGKYGWATPLFSTYRLTSGAESLQLVAGLDNPGLSAFACPSPLCTCRWCPRT